MAEENRGRGYCPTYGEGNGSRQLDVAITMVNIETAENKIPLMPKHSNEAEKPHWRKRCNEIKKKRIYAVPLFLIVAAALSILFLVLFGEGIFKSLFNKWNTKINREGHNIFISVLFISFLQFIADKCFVKLYTIVIFFIIVNHSCKSDIVIFGERFSKLGPFMYCLSYVNGRICHDFGSGKKIRDFFPHFYQHFVNTIVLICTLLCIYMFC